MTPRTLRYCPDRAARRGAARLHSKAGASIRASSAAGTGAIRRPMHAPGEFVVGRLMFPQTRTGWLLGSGPGDWRRGGTAWTVDYPEGDRTFARLLERLTTIDVRARRAAREPRRRHRRVLLAVPDLGARRRLGSHRRAGGEAARVSAARRLPALRQLLRHGRVGRVRRRHPPRVSRSADSRSARQPSDLPLRLRSDRSAADPDLAAPAARLSQRRRRARAGARSSTTTSASW